MTLQDAMTLILGLCLGILFTFYFTKQINCDIRFRHAVIICMK